MQAFLSYWYKDSISRFYHAYLTTVEAFEERLAVRTTLQNIGKPLFQDYSYQGRFIGFLLRLGRIISGVGLYLFVALLYIASFIVWLFFPFICLISIVGAFFGVSA